MPPDQFVVFAQNHDQVGNRAFGDRLPPEARPLAAFCMLLSPFTPLLFMGEEYGEDAPFQFFTDHIDEAIAEATREGRRTRVRKRSRAFASEEMPDPQDAGDVRALEADAPRATRAVAALRATARSAPAPARGRRRRSSSTRTRAGCGCAGARTSWSCNFAADRAASLRRRDVVLATAPPTLADGHVELEPLSGALIA